MSEQLDLDAYLTRIGYHGTPAVQRATLEALHALHVAAIPFENLDPLLDRPVRLDAGTLQAKLVHSRRGGYCFEQNLLFKAALEAIGFRVTGLAARVRWLMPPDRPLGPRTHMLLRVELSEGPYLADVGFGAQLLDAPLKLQIGLEQRTAAASYRLTDTDGVLGLSTRLGGQWQLAYLFTPEPQVLADYEMGSWFTSTHPQTWFRKRLLVQRVTREARYTLSNNQLIVCAHGAAPVERTLGDAEAFGQTLQQVFNLASPAPPEDVFAKIMAA